MDDMQFRRAARSARSRVAAPEQRIGFLIYRAGVAVAQAYERRMRPSGFTPGEVGLLTQLASHGPGHIREIGRALGVSPQTVVNLARGLEAKEMIRRAHPDADRRTVVLDITDRGTAALARADEIACAFDRAIEAVVGRDTQATSRALRKLLDDHSSWDAPRK